MGDWEVESGLSGKWMSFEVEDGIEGRLDYAFQGSAGLACVYKLTFVFTIVLSFR